MINNVDSRIELLFCRYIFIPLRSYTEL